MLEIRKNLHKNYSNFEIEEAKNHVWTRFIRSGNFVEKEVGDVEEPPPHASKLGGEMKSEEDLQEMRQRFVSLFLWMFEGLDEVKELILNGKIDEDERSLDEILEELKNC
uniref:Uncharacterized protein n=1 Tax=Panagrolaimus sp. JU765 TaxID=591449 RepID=A0AC34RSW7_9BILA